MESVVYNLFMKKKLVYIDMDDTIADFRGHHTFPKDKYPFDVHEMYEPGFFLNLKPVVGSLSGVRRIMRMGYDVQILSQPVAESALSYLEKAQWVGLHFPDLIKCVNLTQDKGLFKGDYLIDDNKEKWKDRFESNGGKFIHFDYERRHPEIWHEICEFLQKELKNDTSA